MKKYLLIAAVVIVGFASLYSTTDIMSSSQPPTGKTGAPGEGTCSDCHTNSGGGNGSVSIAFNNGSNLFKYGETYPIAVEVSDAAKMRFGFALTELDQTGITIGEFNVLNPNNTSLQNANNREYVGHFQADENNVWEFEWTAPQASSGITEVNFYIAGNATDNNGGNSGDHVYTTSLMVELDTQGLDDVTNPISNIYQNLNTLHIDYFSEKQTAIEIQLYNMQGQLVERTTKKAQPGNNLFNVLLAQKKAGVHIVSIINGAKAHTGKIVVR